MSTHKQKFMLNDNVRSRDVPSAIMDEGSQFTPGECCYFVEWHNRVSILKHLACSLSVSVSVSVSISISVSVSVSLSVIILKDLNLIINLSFQFQPCIDQNIASIKN